jgi:hypothetical protein
MPLHDISYQHWQGVHLGVWSRRLAIARNGLTGCLRIKWMRHTVAMCWMVALAQVGILFCVGQLLVADSIVVQWLGNLNPGTQSFARMLTTWLEDHPEISVRTTQNVLFYHFTTYLMWGSIYALGMAIPTLITRDLASNAIIIYSSKAVSRGDYLFGKFATAFGLMSLTWLGPVCAAWFVGNLLAPDWGFFWHSRVALLHSLLFVLTGMVALSLLALGVSAISKKEKSTVSLWYVWWILGFVLAPIAISTGQTWLRHLSFNYDLDQVALAIFRIGRDLATALENIPVIGQVFAGVNRETIAALNQQTAGNSVVCLFLMLAGAAVILRNRVKPE